MSESAEPKPKPVEILRGPFGAVEIHGSVPYFYVRRGEGFKPPPSYSGPYVLIHMSSDW